MLWLGHMGSGCGNRETWEEINFKKVSIRELGMRRELVFGWMFGLKEEC